MGGVRSPTTVALLVGAVLLASAGVGSVVFVVTDTGEPIGVEAGDRYAEIDAVTGETVTVVRRDGETSRTVARVSRRPGTGMERTEIVRSEQAHYELTVANGSRMWLYDQDTDTVERIPLSGPEDVPGRGERIEQLFTALNLTDRSASATVSGESSVSPLPVVPSGDASHGSVTDESVYKLIYEGTETVAGRETYVLRIAVADGTFLQKLWVDTEWFYPLARYTEWTENGDHVSVRTSYRTVTFDPEIPDDRFQFDPPQSATVEQLDTPRTRTYHSLEAVRANTSTTVPSPEVPPSFGLAYATRTTGQIESVGLKYVNETSWVSVAKYDRPFAASGGDRQVIVDGRPAELSVGSTLSLSWRCEEYRYTVRGRRVSPELLVEIGQSVGCDQSTGQRSIPRSR